MIPRDNEDFVSDGFLSAHLKSNRKWVHWPGSNEVKNKKHKLQGSAIKW
jgi:hypothetical protein